MALTSKKPRLHFPFIIGILRRTCLLVACVATISLLPACNTAEQMPVSTADTTALGSAVPLDTVALKGIWVVAEGSAATPFPAIQFGSSSALDLFKQFAVVGRGYEVSGADSVVFYFAADLKNAVQRKAYRVVSVSGKSLVLDAGPGSRIVYQRSDAGALPIVMGEGLLTGTEEVFKVNIDAAGKFRMRLLSEPYGAALTLRDAQGAALATLETDYQGAFPAGGEYSLIVDRARAPQKGPIQVFLQMERLPDSTSR